MDVVLVASEVAPWSKSGGLGDVTGALGPRLVERGHRVLVVSPLYRSVDRAQLEDTGVQWGFHLGGSLQGVRYYRSVVDGVVYVFVEHLVYRRSGLYGDANGSFGDNHLRFALLARAGIEAARRVPLAEGEAPIGEDVLFHVHDWQAALLPVYLEAWYRPLGLFQTAAVVQTIHNLAHQGHVPSEMFAELDLPSRWMSPHCLEFHGHVNLLKGGLLTADQITTVSPTFAAEITTPDGGFGLDGVLRHRKSELTGILNGIDTDVWNPATDPFLPANYSRGDLDGKTVCKTELQKALGLPVDPDVPMIATVSRLDPQKGVDLFLDSLPWIVRNGAQVVALGTAAAAHERYEWRLREAEHTWRSQVRAWIGFSEEMAHRFEAAADLFSMPSLFEPCGLNQLYSLRYGTVPIVRSTGGLADSVVPFQPFDERGTGWVFRSSSPEAYRNAVHEALYTYREHPRTFGDVRDRGMARDSSWERVVPEYEAVYERARAQRAPVS